MNEILFYPANITIWLVGLNKYLVHSRPSFGTCIRVKYRLFNDGCEGTFLHFLSNKNKLKSWPFGECGDKKRVTRVGEVDPCYEKMLKLSFEKYWFASLKVKGTFLSSVILYFCENKIVRLAHCCSTRSPLFSRCRHINNVKSWIAPGTTRKIARVNGIVGAIVATAKWCTCPNSRLFWDHLSWDKDLIKTGRCQSNLCLLCIG